LNYPEFIEFLIGYVNNRRIQDGFEIFEKPENYIPPDNMGEFFDNHIEDNFIAPVFEAYEYLAKEDIPILKKSYVTQFQKFSIYSRHNLILSFCSVQINYMVFYKTTANLRKK